MSAPPASSEARAAWVLEKTRPTLRGLKPYYQAPLQGDPLRLDQNTHLLGPNPALRDVDLAQLDVSQYPTRDSDALRDALGRLHGLDPDRFLCANGSDELLDVITRTFTRPGDRLATTLPSYSLYPFYATLQDLDLVQVPLGHRFQLDVDRLLEVQATVTVVACPNNPTGNRFPRDDLLRLVEESDGMVVIDEAYIEYANEDGKDLSLIRDVDEHDNLIVTRTFSKAYGLAGLRTGYLAANQEVTRRLLLTKPPYNVNVVSEALAVAALQHTAWLQDNVAQVQGERERLADRLRTLGFRVHPSDANFILCDAPTDPAVLQAGLKRHNILARTFPGKPRLEQTIRFTVGAPEHTDALVTALEAVLGEEAP